MIRRVQGDGSYVGYRTDDGELWDYKGNAVARANYLCLETLLETATDRRIDTKTLNAALANARNVAPEE